MPDFTPGDRIFHAGHGLGTVGWVGAEYIGVTFDELGKVLIRRDGAEFRPATAADACQPPPSPSQAAAEGFPPAPPEPFFVMEAGDDEHSMGSHWEPFADEATTILACLPEALPRAQLRSGYSEIYPPPTRTAVVWPRGALLLATSEALAPIPGFERSPSHPWDSLTSWRSPGGALDSTPERAMGQSERDTGIATVLRLAESAARNNEVRSLFPYCAQGIEHTLTLEQVHVWEGRLEAQIEATLGEAEITFFDIDFILNRDWYGRGLTAQFILTGIAYDAAEPKTKSFTIPRTVEHFESMEWLTGEDRRPESGALEETFQTQGMAMLLPIDAWDRDDYQFRGPIKEVWGMSILGQRAWRVRTTVLRISGRDPEDVELGIVITERAWQGDAPPQAGQDIEGQLWLQGRLWNTSP